jgi:hypothetical protein
VNTLDYTEFDKALLANIAAGRNTMMQLYNKKSPLHDLAAPFASDGTPVARIIDRRLQALRKRRAVEYDGKVWTRVTKASTV